MSEGNPISPDHNFANQMDINCQDCQVDESGRGQQVQKLHLRKRALTHPGESDIIDNLKKFCDGCAVQGKPDPLTLEASKSCAWRGNP